MADLTLSTRLSFSKESWDLNARAQRTLRDIYPLAIKATQTISLAAPTILYVSFRVNVHDAGDQADYIHIGDGASNFIAVFKTPGDLFEFYDAIGGGQSNFGLITIDTWYTLEMQIVFSGGVATITPRADGIELIPFSSPTLVATIIQFGSLLGSLVNNHQLDDLKIGTTAWGSSDIFSADFNDFLIVPPFDSITGTGVDALDATLTINNAGTDAYATRNIDLGWGGPEILNLGDTTIDTGIGYVFVRNINPVPSTVVFGLGGSTDYPAKLNVGDFALIRWQGGDVWGLSYGVPTLIEYIIIPNSIPVPNPSYNPPPAPQTIGGVSFSGNLLHQRGRTFDAFLNFTGSLDTRITLTRKSLTAALHSIGNLIFKVGTNRNGSLALGGTLTTRHAQGAALPGAFLTLSGAITTRTNPQSRPALTGALSFSAAFTATFKPQMAFDDFEAYTVGNYSSLTLSSSTSGSDTTFSTGDIWAVVANYGAEDFEAYSTGAVTTFTAGAGNTGDTSLDATGTLLT